MNIGLQTVILATLLQLRPAIAQVSQLDVPRFWTAFECAAYAELAEDEPEFVRLLNTGFQKGKTFLETTKGERTPFAKLFPMLPDDVTIRLEGPTVEFSLGRIYEDKPRGVWDRVMRQDQYGAWLPLTEWRYTKHDASRILARERYRDLACQSIK